MPTPYKPPHHGLAQQDAKCFRVSASMLRRLPRHGALPTVLARRLSVNTHHQIDQSLCGTPRELRTGFAKVEMITSPVMSADDRGLTHGGFYFGMADYAAMLAVNDPNVVLGAADSCRFLKPVKLGDTLHATATLSGEKGKKRIVDVIIERGEETVFTGTFTCFVLEKHVLDT